MPPDVEEKDPLVFLEPEILLLSGGLPGARLYEGKDPDEKSEDGSFFAVKTTKLVGEEGAAYVEQKKEETKKKRAERNKAKKSGRRQKQPSRVKAAGRMERMK